jgi:hypothetical protein
MSVFVSVLGVGIAALQATPASACPPMQTVILIDQSGSMLLPGSTGVPKWQIARDIAFDRFTTLPAGTVVSIAGFENASIGATPYYSTVVSLAANKIKGTDDAFLLGKIADTFADIGNMTPLAGAACHTINELWLFAPGGDPTCTLTTRRDVYLYSDGLENSTPATPTPGTDPNCFGPDSTSAFDVTLAGRGFGLTAGSWQRKVANMAYNGNPLADFIDIPPAIRPVMNVALLFDFVPSFSSRSLGLSSESDPHGTPSLTASAPASVDPNGVAFFKGLSTVSFGSYFEAKQVNGVVTKIPLPGDTNPEPTLSCVDQLDLNRILEAFGRTVRNNDPSFSGAELAQRDVNNDLVIDIKDYALATQNFGKCR